MNEKQKKKLKIHQSRRRNQRQSRAVGSDSRRESTGETNARASEMNIQREMDYIVNRALERVATIVSLGPLVFFSTETGDAWMLEAEDGLALCLARGGVPEPVRVVDTETQTGVEFDREFSIAEDAFMTSDKRTGRETAILGYPTEAIANALARALKEWNFIKRLR